MRAEKALIARRHVIYVGGYDPQGAEGYYRLFERSWKRFLTIWPLTSKLGPLELDAEDFAHWDVEAAGPNWRVATRYEFLRQEHMIRANMAEPMTRHESVQTAPGNTFVTKVTWARLFHLSERLRG